MTGQLVPEKLTDQQLKWLAKASREDRNGWIYLKTGGEPFERGFQHGYLTAAEYAEALRTYQAMTYLSTGMEYSFFVAQAAELQKSLIPPELLQEMEGIAAGFSSAGVPRTVDDIIGWNAYEELTGYWWPTVMQQYAAAPVAAGSLAKSHCSAFIASGSATTTGRIVVGHESFTEFWNGQYMNMILDITPTDGHRMVMQGCPGWVASMTDFWVTSAGLVVTETTIVGYSGYDVKKIPEYVRARLACQYADSIEGWVDRLDAGNNGGYANMWLVGDLKTNEIAEYEQGLTYQGFRKTGDGWFFGCNAPNDPRIRNLECSDTGYSDVRQQTGARRVRWTQLLNQYAGSIDEGVAQRMLGDTFDPYEMRINPSSRCICAHYDVDPQFYASDPNAVWNVPYFPGGSVDGKVTTAALATNMGLQARFGRADGTPFVASEFLRIHPQWGWQGGYLKDRPHQPWTIFDGR